MRYRWIYGAAAIVTMLSIPAVSQAQANPCDAYSGDSTVTTSGHPTCSVTKNATATIGNLLKLAVVNANVDLIKDAADTIPFFNTWTANGSAAGTTGSAPATVTDLYQAPDTNLVIAQGNRGFVVNVKAQDAVFNFDVANGVCRKPATDQAHCTTAAALAGKPVGDIFFHPENGTNGGSWLQLTTSDQELFSSVNGARFTSGIELKSAWYYATDIAGSYTATLVYTITGQ